MHLYVYLSNFSDNASELGGENEGVPISSASSVSNDPPSELPTMMSETDDSNSYSLEPSSSETESYFGTGSRGSSEATIGSTSKDQTGDGANSKFPQRPGITWRKGERLEAMDYLQKWYPAKITEIDAEEMCVLIHFEGWNQRYDEWVEMDSDNLRPLTRHSERRDKIKREKTVYKAGDQVLAKWTDCKMYLAKIDDVLNDGSYSVLFYDGFKKIIQPINLRPVPSDLKHQKFRIKPPMLSPKDLKKLKHKPVDYKDTPGTSDTQPIATPPHPHPHPHRAGHKRKKLIISGSLFAKKDKPENDEEKAEKCQAPETQMKPLTKNKEGGKVRVKQEVKVEAPSGVEEKIPGTEASSQTEVATCSEPPAKKKKRAGSFPPAVGKGRKPSTAGRIAKATKAVSPAGVKKAKSADEGKVMESQAALTTVPGVPPKAFVVEEDHNSYKCTVPGCNKGFRKAGLLASHVKYYHCQHGGPPSTPHVPRKRKKTLSTCSTDSDISVSSRSTSTKRRRHVSEISLTASPDLAVRMSFDEDSPNNPGRPPELPQVDEGPGAETEEELSEEVVNCICGLREENGLMIQCDSCLCWQHTQCLNITEEDLSNNSTYICFICKRPPGVRDSCRYLYDLDWFRKGRLPTFGFLKLMASERRQRELLASHDLVGEMLKVQRVMHGLREEIAVTGERDHPELRLWHPKPKKETRSVSACTSDDTLTSSVQLSSSDNKPGSQDPASVAMYLPQQNNARDGTSPQSKDEDGRSSQKTKTSDFVVPQTECVPKSQESHSQDQQSDTTMYLPGPSDSLPFKPLIHAAEGVKMDIKTGSAITRTSSEQQASSAQAPEENGTGPQSAGVRNALGGASGSISPVSNSQPVMNGKIKPECGNLSPLTHAVNSISGRMQEGVSEGQVGTGVNQGTESPERAVQDTPSCDQSGRRSFSGPAEIDSSGQMHTQETGIDVKAKIKAEVPDTDGEQQTDDVRSVETVQMDQFADCKMSVLGYVHKAQDELALALDALEVQISDLERHEFGEESAGSFGNIPSLKHSLYRIARDLNKVKGIASYR